MFSSIEDDDYDFGLSEQDLLEAALTVEEKVISNAVEISSTTISDQYHQLAKQEQPEENSSSVSRKNFSFKRSGPGITATLCRKLKTQEDTLQGCQQLSAVNCARITEILPKSNSDSVVEVYSNDNQQMQQISSPHKLTWSAQATCNKSSVKMESSHHKQSPQADDQFSDSDFDLDISLDNMFDWKPKVDKYSDAEDSAKLGHISNQKGLSYPSDDTCNLDYNLEFTFLRNPKTDVNCIRDENMSLKQTDVGSSFSPIVHTRSSISHVLSSHKQDHSVSSIKDKRNLQLTKHTLRSFESNFLVKSDTVSNNTARVIYAGSNSNKRLLDSNANAKVKSTSAPKTFVQEAVDKDAATPFAVNKPAISTQSQIQQSSTKSSTGQTGRQMNTPISSDHLEGFLPAVVSNMEIEGQLSIPSGTVQRCVSLKRKRKFPGPAGNLPKLDDHEKLLDIVIPEATPCTLPKTPCPAPDALQDDFPVSQNAADYFHEGPWSEMKRDLQPGADQLLSQYTIADIIQKANRKLLPHGKVPVLGVVIDGVIPQIGDASVLFRDPTGVMPGTLHRQLVKSYPVLMLTGSVLLLRQVGVFSPSSHKHYLNVTPNNLVYIYSKSSSGDTKKSILNRLELEDLKSVYENISPQNADTVPRHLHQPEQDAHTNTVQRFNNKLNDKAPKNLLSQSCDVKTTSNISLIDNKSFSSTRNKSFLISSHALQSRNQYLPQNVTKSGQEYLNKITVNSPCSQRGTANAYITHAKSSSFPNHTPSPVNRAHSKARTFSFKRSPAIKTHNANQIDGRSNHSVNDSSAENKPHGNEELWPDDNLDDLLTELDEEIMCDFR